MKPRRPQCSCPADMRKFTPDTHLPTCREYPLLKSILPILACAWFCGAAWIFAVWFVFRGAN